MNPPPTTSGFEPPWPVDQSRLDRNWRAITIELDAPRPGRLERFLRFVRMPANVSRLVAATPALRRSWFLATAFAMLIGLAAADGAQPRADLFVLLLIGPLVPVLGITLAYGPEADPAHEVALATPIRGIRLITIRATAVLAFSSFWLVLCALAAPGRSVMAFAGLVPSLGLTAATVAMMTALRPRLAAGVTAGLWLVGVLATRGGPDPLTAFTAGGQLVMAVLAAVSIGIAVARRDRFDHLAGGLA